MTVPGSAVVSSDEVGDVWRALANPVRRRLLDELAGGPRTTGELDVAIPELSRFAVMQHLGVLTDAGLVLVRRRGRYRYNHLNPVPLRRWYEQWVAPLADGAAAELLALQRDVESGGGSVSSTTEQVRTVRIESELRFRAVPEQVFSVLTERTAEWFPLSYGGERLAAIVVEPWVGGRHFEDWGDGAGYLYGHVTVFDPPRRYATRGRIMAGTILDTDYLLTAADEDTVLAMTKTAFGPMTEEEAASIATYGDVARFEDALRGVIEAER